MRLINVLNKEKADELKAHGFDYREIQIDSQTVYQFIECKELIDELSSKFEECSFFISSYMNF